MSHADDDNDHNRIRRASCLRQKLTSVVDVVLQGRASVASYEYEYTIDGSTGAILEHEKDHYHDDRHH